jgi:hypothetical protein
MGVIQTFQKNRPISPSPFFTTEDASLFLEFEGADGSTTFLDSSSYSHSISATNATIETDQHAIGSSSGYFPSNGFLTTPVDSSLDIRSGEFTIEGFLYATSLATNSGFAFFGDIASNSHRIQVDYKTDGSVAFYIEDGTLTLGDNLLAPAGTITVNNRYHIAAVQSGTMLMLFINGAIVATGARTKTVSTLPTLFYVGSARNGGAQRYCTGYIDHFLVTKSAKYTSNFYVPL